MAHDADVESSLESDRPASASLFRQPKSIQPRCVVSGDLFALRNQNLCCLLVNKNCILEFLSLLTLFQSHKIRLSTFRIGLAPWALRKYDKNICRPFLLFYYVLNQDFSVFYPPCYYEAQPSQSFHDTAISLLK